MEGMSEEEFLCIFGLYALSPQIFDLLGADIESNVRLKGEFQLTTCLEKLRTQQEMTGYIVDGKLFDIGMPHAYLESLMNFTSIDG